MLYKYRQQKIIELYRIIELIFEEIPMTDKKKSPYPQSLALNKWEQKETYRKMIEINNKLSEKDMRGISKESELLHRIIELALPRLDVSESGTIILK
ncbi:MAG: hypothetical protein Q4A00_07660 [Flavobacteriaceae bacterium]|nr:hypothetical protein [Flavobacteriaceae bacterium]